MEYGGRRIVGVGLHFVSKFGVGINLIEGENMLFVQENTNVPVPRVFALYSNPETRKNYIVMERIVGQKHPYMLQPSRNPLFRQRNLKLSRIIHLPIRWCKIRVYV
jgi:hypothetical protein